MSNGDAGQPELTDAFRKVTIEAARPCVYIPIEEAPQGKWLLPIFKDGADVFKGSAHNLDRLGTQF